MANLGKQGSAMLSSFFQLIGADEHSLANSEFVGTWEVHDSHGTAFEITLFGSGTAEANRAGEGMSGTWVEEGPSNQASAVISWDTGWTTKIAKTEEGYAKIAYDAVATTPVNTSPARKIE